MTPENESTYYHFIEFPVIPLLLETPEEIWFELTKNRLLIKVKFMGDTKTFPFLPFHLVGS